jgi:hypothetical protein
MSEEHLQLATQPDRRIRGMRAKEDVCIEIILAIDRTSTSRTLFENRRFCSSLKSVSIEHICAY